MRYEKLYSILSSTIFVINYVNISYRKINFMLSVIHKHTLKNITFLISQETYLHNNYSLSY